MARGERINLGDKLASFVERWDPKLLDTIDDYEIKVVKLQGDFVWHCHAGEDEMFLVLKGSFRMDFRDREQWLEAGEFLIVPRGVEHRPVAPDEVSVLLFEPAGTLNTGTAGGVMTVAEPERL